MTHVYRYRLIDPWAYGYSCLGRDSPTCPVQYDTGAIDIDVGIGHGYDELGKGGM